jgi:hypothetical protein
MNTRTTAEVFAAVAARACSHPTMESAVMGAVRATLPGVIETVMRELYSGETLRLYVSKRPTEDRAQRDRRIGAALASGEAPESVAKRESVSKRHVFRVKARIVGHLLP